MSGHIVITELMVGADFQVCYFYGMKSYPEFPLFKSFQVHWQYIDWNRYGWLS